MAHPKQMTAGAAAMPVSTVKYRLLRRSVTSVGVRPEAVLDTEAEGRWYFECHGGSNWEGKSVEFKNEWRAHAERMKKAPLCKGKTHGSVVQGTST